MLNISKQKLTHKNNNIVIRVDYDEIMCYHVTVGCARRGKVVKGLLTCSKKGIPDAKKRLIKNLLIH